MNFIDKCHLVARKARFPNHFVVQLIDTRNSQLMVISFRGTEFRDQDAIQNMKWIMDPLANCDKPAFVHRGIQQQYLYLRDEIRQKVERYVKQFDPSQVPDV